MNDVLLVTPTFHPEPLGTPAYATDLARWLSDRGHTVTVLTSQPYYPEFKRYPGYGRGTRRELYEGMVIHRLPTLVPRQGRPQWRALSELNFLAQGLHARITGRVGRHPAVISISAGTPLVPLLAAQFTTDGASHVALVHDIQSGLAEQLGLLGKRLVPVARKLEAAALNRADELHALTPQMADALQSIGVYKKIQTTPLWVTVPDDAIPRTGNYEVDVQYSGNLGRKQGVMQLLELAKLLQAEAPHRRMRIRGDGSMLPTLRAALIASGLTNVELHPLVDPEDLAASLAASPLHVIPQQHGCAPFAVPSKIVNILACGGVAIVGTDDTSAIRTLGEQTPAVRCVRSGDVAQMARLAAELLDDAELLRRLSDEARRFAAATWERDVVLAQLTSTTMSSEPTHGPPEQSPPDLDSTGWRD